jgi:exosortase/archaeosortase family protein
VPISIAANIVRLVLLALVTYYFGDSSGQHFFHDYSPFLLFVFSLMSLVVVDVLLDRRRPSEARV